MSPAMLQVVQDSPSGHLMSSGVLDLFWSSSKTRRDGPEDNYHHPKNSNDGDSTSDFTGTSSTEGGDTSYPGQCSGSGCSQTPTFPDSDDNTLSTPFPSPPVQSTALPTISTPAMSTSVNSSGATESRPSATSTSPLSTSPSSPLNSSSTPAGSSTQAKPHSNTGAIIGGIVGGVVLLSIAALVLFIFLRRRRRMKHTAPSAEFLHPNSPFQRLNTARSGSPTRTRSVFDMLPSPNNGDAGGKSLLRSLSRRDYKSPPTLEKVTVDTTSAVHAL